jgi:hypothetical protein
MDVHADDGGSGLSYFTMEVVQMAIAETSKATK